MDIGTRLTQLENKMAKLERSSRLSSASVDDAAIEVRDGAGSLRALVGQQADGTTAVNVVNGPVPPTPSAPYTASVLGGIAAAWDGNFTDDQVLPLDFSRVEVHASATAGFTPTSATLQNTIETPQGAVVTISTETPLYVRLVTRNTSGNASDPSAQNGPIAPALVVADDVADGIITGSKLAADAIDGKTITGATLRTAATGQRVVIAPSETVGENAVRLYSGVASEVEPGELIAIVDTDAGHPRPSLILWAPAVEAGTSAGLKLISGGGTENDQGEFFLSTGDGSGANTYLYAYAADGGAGLGQFTVRVEQPGTGTEEVGDFTATADTMDWTDARNKGWTHSSTDTTDVFEVTGQLAAQYGTVSEEGTWSTPTFNAWKQSTNSTYQTVRVSRGAKRARLDGCAMVATAMSSGVQQDAFTIPSGYRPAKAHYFAIPFVTGSTPALLGCRVGADGVVSVWSNATRAVNDLFDFSTLSWPLD
ncbi:hypothetical protein [Streptomyces sp. NBC_01353]|uniref:hypothetical protein n=1 Tax=Streptomyces sp. NBC_01353 TaxID=2903835 RepID=UPI002E2EF156|nr:hypothetical protein [Streptomyces sp. NBC_01353]